VTSRHSATGLSCRHADGTRAWLRRCGVFLLSTGLTAGCNQGEPQVASDVPKVEPAATPDLSSGKLPKGMPKNTTAGLKLDPASGRPVSR